MHLLLSCGNLKVASVKGKLFCGWRMAMCLPWYPSVQPRTFHEGAFLLKVCLTSDAYQFWCSLILVMIICKNLWFSCHPYRYHRTQWNKGETIHKEENRRSIFTTVGHSVLFFVNYFSSFPIVFCSSLIICIGTTKHHWTKEKSFTKNRGSLGTWQIVLSITDH